MRYAKLTDATLVSAVDAGVSALNTAIKAGEASDAYRVIDVYTAFKNSAEVLTNASNPSTPLDPHPNAAGHTVIAKFYANLAVPTTLSPQTGDESQTTIFALLTASSFLLFAITFAIKKKSV